MPDASRVTTSDDYCKLTVGSVSSGVCARDFHSKNYSKIQPFTLSGSRVCVLSDARLRFEEPFPFILVFGRWRGSHVPNLHDKTRATNQREE